MKMSKRFFSLLVCICMFCVISFAGLCVSAETRVSDGVVTRRAIVMSAPYEWFVFKNTHDQMINAFTQSQADISTCYSHEQQVNGSKANFLGAITSNLKYGTNAADADDVSYVYINSHGGRDNRGSYLGINGQSAGILLYMDELKDVLDTIPGHIVLMLDSCHSGGAVRQDNGDASEKIDYAQEMMRDFFASSGNARSAEFNGDNKYTVLCSCLPFQYSNSSYDPNNGSYSYASYAWALGFGWNIHTHQKNDIYHSWFADNNSDCILTISEMYDYAESIIQLEMGYSEGQNMCYYSASDYYSLFYKCPTGTTHANPLGDVNQDGFITSVDAALVHQYVVGTASLTTRQQQLADMNDSGAVSLADYLAILQYINAMA